MLICSGIAGLLILWLRTLWPAAQKSEARGCHLGVTRLRTASSAVHPVREAGTYQADLIIFDRDGVLGDTAETT